MLWHHFAIRLGLALILGAFIGAERQWRQRMAGLRTNALVAAGAAMFVMLTALTARADDSFRIAGQVVSGIGFLGAGVILRNGLNITGLNTAATLWCSAAIGTLAGYGLYGSAVTGAIAVTATNVCLRPIGKRLTAERGRWTRTLPICFGLPRERSRKPICALSCFTPLADNRCFSNPSRATTLSTPIRLMCKPF
jgi:putative Mg2+ transporter-C (MgtC) family protein